MTGGLSYGGMTIWFLMAQRHWLIPMVDTSNLGAAHGSPTPQPPWTLIGSPTGIIFNPLRRRVGAVSGKNHITFHATPKGVLHTSPVVATLRRLRRYPGS